MGDGKYAATLPLFGGQSISTKVALFPLDQYPGQIVSDLFGEDSYFADTDQFWTLQNQAVATKRDDLREAGWIAVTVLEPMVLRSREAHSIPSAWSLRMA